MQNAWLDESEGGINNFRYAHDTTLMAERKKATEEPTIRKVLYFRHREQ